MKGCQAVLLWGVLAIVALPVLVIIQFFLFPESYSERKTEKFTLPTGEVISNDSYLASGFQDLTRYNKFYLLEKSSWSRQELSGEVLTQGEEAAIPVNNGKIFRLKNYILVVIDPYLFVQRIPNPPKSPLWRQFSIMPDTSAELFFRSFCPVGDARLEAPRLFSGDYTAGVAAFQSFPSYRFDHLSDDGETLFTRRPLEPKEFPEFIAYKITPYGDWSFDLDSTRAASHLTPPATPPLVIDISIVAAPVHHSYMDSFSRDGMLASSGAKEIFAKTYPLDTTNWNTFDCLFDPPFGKTSIRVSLGFMDGTPGFLTLRWQGIHNQPECRLAAIDTWLTPFEGIENGVSKIIYYRVRKP